MKTVVCVNSDCTLSCDTETVSKDTIHKNLHFRLNFIIFYMNNKIVCTIVVEFVSTKHVLSRRIDLCNIINTQCILSLKSVSRF